MRGYFLPKNTSEGLLVALKMSGGISIKNGLDFLLPERKLSTFMFSRCFMTARVRKNKPPVSVCLPLCMYVCRPSEFLLDK